VRSLQTDRQTDRCVWTYYHAPFAGHNNPQHVMHCRDYNIRWQNEQLRYVPIHGFNRWASRTINTTGTVFHTVHAHTAHLQAPSIFCPLHALIVQLQTRIYTELYNINWSPTDIFRDVPYTSIGVWYNTGLQKKLFLGFFLQKPFKNLKVHILGFPGFFKTNL